MFYLPIRTKKRVL